MLITLDSEQDDVLISDADEIDVDAPEEDSRRG